MISTGSGRFGALRPFDRLRASGKRVSPRRMAAQAGIVPSRARRGDISHQCSDFCGKVRPESIERAGLRRRSRF
jgi:hypothetical protein